MEDGAEVDVNQQSGSSPSKSGETSGSRSPIARILGFLARHPGKVVQFTLFLLATIVVFQNIESTSIDVLFWSVPALPKLVVIFLSMVLGAVLVMATTHLLAKSVGEVPRASVIARTALSAAGVTLAFFALEGGASWILGGAVAAAPEPGAGTLAVMGLVVVAFAAVTLLQTQLPARATEPAWRAAYVHLKNGLYANALFDRMAGTLR